MILGVHLRDCDLWFREREELGSASTCLQSFVVVFWESFEESFGVEAAQALFEFWLAAAIDFD